MWVAACCAGPQVSEGRSRRGDGMKNARLGAMFAVLVAAVVATVISAAAGASSRASGCDTKIVGQGRFGGVERAVRLGCQARSNTSEAANGTPPLIWHNGPMMGTPT